MNRCEHHGDCVRQIVTFAEDLCRERGLRLTPLRRRVLEIVSGGHRPVKAYTILDAISDSARPPTVYRALDFLMENGLVHKLHSLSSYFACFHPASRHPDCFFLTCSVCGGAAEFCADGLRETMDDAARGEGFRKSGAVVEITGICRECARG